MTERQLSRSRAAWQRVAASAATATVAGTIAAALDSAWARRAVAEPPALGATLLADAGLIAPIALGCGIAVGVASLFLHPADAPSPRRVALRLRDADPESRAYLAALAPLSALGVVAFLVISARLALRLFAATTSPVVIALGVAVAACVSALLITLLVLALAERASRLWKSAPDPALAGALGALAAAALLTLLISAGETSGGGGVLGLFGVLKRPELDLRAPALLLLVALAAYLLPAALRRVPSAVLLGLGVLPLLLTLRSAGSALDDRRVAVTIERSAPLGKLALGVGRKLSDRDKDGFSSRFGGGDCDDRDARINPGAEDVPGNGRDEDCSGQDDVAVSLKASQPASDAGEKARPAAALPADLSVILITIDTLRFDLGHAGNPRPVSPNLDRLAKRSVVFDNAYALASYTSKSLPPMLIGKYPSETDRGWSHFNRFGKRDTFVQERLQSAGVRTVSVQGYWYFFQAGVGFERGFDVVDSSAAPRVVQMEGDKSANSDKLSDAALEQLKKPENTAKRFFCWVHYIDPHTEYVLHEGFDFGKGSRERYDSEVAFVDHHVGRILEHVEKSDLGKRTAIIVTSDHGEAFGEHGMIRHGFELWEELVRVPLIVYVPGVAPRRIQERRSAIDVVPTLLELYGQKPPSGEGDDFVSGESLMPDLFPAPGRQPEKKIVFVDMPAGPNNADRQAFIENDLKLITSDTRPLGLYDLRKDPAEKHDLLDEPEQKEKVVSRFKAFRRDLRVVRVKPIPK
ncbi:MAG TPA: sulfatase-like hydrolase/transferase [Polyangiaceae bacterium]